MEIKIALNNTLPDKEKNPLLKSKSRTHLFKSRMHEIAFYFEVNQSIFDQELDIKRIHTKDTAKAKKLRRDYLNLFHPDKNNDTDFDYERISKDITNLFFRVTGGKL
ncbi:hypothetical protein ABRP72_14215 [Pectobacterium carotovorum]|uniref:hypothetical protein n=1 Tax=Pectobacterium carotovorum TaxID=554 RepID=UPI0032EDAF44